MGYELDRVQNEAMITLLGTRIIIIRAGTWVRGQKRLEELSEEEASASLYEMGMTAAKESTKVLLEQWEERGGDFLKRWGDFYSSTGVGWFKLEEIDVDPEKREGHLKITQSCIAGEYGPSAKPVCHYLAGFFVGVLEEVLGGRLVCEETLCAAKGDPYCEFRFQRY